MEPFGHEHLRITLKSEQDAGKAFGLVVNEGERVVLLSPDGTPVAALIPVSDLERLEQIEDTLDAEAGAVALEEADREGYLSLVELDDQLRRSG